MEANQSVRRSRIYLPLVTGSTRPPPAHTTPSLPSPSPLTRTPRKQQEELRSRDTYVCFRFVSGKHLRGIYLLSTADDVRYTSTTYSSTLHQAVHTSAQTTIAICSLSLRKATCCEGSVYCCDCYDLGRLSRGLCHASMCW